MTRDGVICVRVASICIWHVVSMVFISILGCTWVLQGVSVLSYLQRDRATAPHGSYRGDDFSDMETMLTEHLGAEYGAAVKDVSVRT